MRARLNALRERCATFLTRRPLVTFFIVLALLLGLIITSHLWRKPEPEPEAPRSPAKAVNVYVPKETTPRLSLPARVEKESSMPVTALASGIVTKIHARPGASVRAGEVILELTDDYQSNQAHLERARAQEEYALAQELAELDKEIAELEEERIDDDATLSDLEEEIALEGLKREREAREANLRIARLNLEITRRNEATLRPTALVSGTLENLTVQVGDHVAPGAVLGTLRGTSSAVALTAWSSAETRALVDPARPAIMIQGDRQEEIAPAHLASGENGDGLYALRYVPKTPLTSRVTEGTYVELLLPLLAQKDDRVLVPLDAIFQDGSRAWVLVEQDGRAASFEVALGSLYGSFAEVAGLAADARVILDRSVIAGDPVTIR